MDEVGDGRVKGITDRFLFTVPSMLQSHPPFLAVGGLPFTGKVLLQTPQENSYHSQGISA